MGPLLTYYDNAGPETGKTIALKHYDAPVALSGFQLTIPCAGNHSQHEWWIINATSYQRVHLYYTKSVSSTNISKDDSIFCGCNFDAGFDVGEILWTHDNWLRFLHQLQISCTQQAKQIR